MAAFSRGSRCLLGNIDTFRLFLLLIDSLLIRASVSQQIVYHIGTTASPTGASDEARLAVDKWNVAHPNADFRLSLLAAPAKGQRARLCSLAQRSPLALLLQDDSDAELSASAALCAHHRLPCLALRAAPTPAYAGVSAWLDGRRGDDERAAVALLDELDWTSYVVLYDSQDALLEAGILLGARAARSPTSARQKLYLRKIPSQRSGDGSRELEPFLKHVRDRLRVTRIVLEVRNLSLVHAVLAQAAQLDMMTAEYAYLFMHVRTDQLDDFFKEARPKFACQVVFLQRDPPISLAERAVQVIGAAVQNLLDAGEQPPQPRALLCDAAVERAEFGPRLTEHIKIVIDQMDQGQQTPSTISGDENGENGDDRQQNVSQSGTLLRAYHFSAGTGPASSSRRRPAAEWDERLRTWRLLDDRLARHFRFSANPTDLTGYTLRVVVYPEEPFVMRDAETGHYFGFCIDVLDELAAALHFNYTIFSVPDDTYGIEDAASGQWSGVVGVLQRREADLAVSALTISYSRVQVIDFTLPFMHLGISILTRGDGDGPSGSTSSSASSTSLFTFLEPLSVPVWVALVGAYLAVSFMMFLMAKFSPYEWYNMSGDAETARQRRRHTTQKNQFTLLNSLWFAIGSLMQQGSDVIPRAAATRSIAVVWWLFTQIVIASYTAQLAAFLTVERMATPIESTADLAAQTRIRFGTLRNGSTWDFFRDSKIPIYERMWAIMESASPSVFVGSTQEGLARVLAGNYAYLMESSMVEYYMARDCRLHVIGGLLDSKGYGMAVPKGSPLRDLFSRALLQLQERTVLEALKNKWWRDKAGIGICEDRQGGGREGGAGPRNTSFQNIVGIFYVLMTGVAVAFLLAIAEFFVAAGQPHDRMRTELTTLGALVRCLCAPFRRRSRHHNPHPEHTTSIRETRLEQADAHHHHQRNSDRNSGEYQKRKAHPQDSIQLNNTSARARQKKANTSQNNNNNNNVPATATLPIAMLPISHSDSTTSSSSSSGSGN